MPTATPKSGLEPAPSRATSRFPALARLSLLLPLLAMVPGCLVDDPPAYTQPKRTPPRLDYHNAQPPLDQILTIEDDDPLEFSIPVASEDAGEELTAQLFLDSTSFLNYVSIAPSTLDDTTRVITVPARLHLQKSEAGCHRFTLRVAHRRSLPTGIEPPLDITDVAEAYWWANVFNDPTQADSLIGCPQSSQAPMLIGSP